MRAAVLVALCAAAAWGQTARRVFSLAPDDTPQNVQEIANAVRTIADISQLSIDDQARVLTVSGTAEQIALADWLVKGIETNGSGALAYTIAGAADDARHGSGNQVRIFYLPNLPNQQTLQEFVNAVRTVADAAKVYQYWKTRAIAMRLTAGQAALAEWLIEALNRPAATAPSMSAFTASGMLPVDTVAARVFYRPETMTAQQLQETVVAIRSEANIPRIYSVFAPRAIALRGTDAQVLQAEGLLANH
jgi:hypothetical protein